MHNIKRISILCVSSSLLAGSALLAQSSSPSSSSQTAGSTKQPGASSASSNQSGYGSDHSRSGANQQRDSMDQTRRHDQSSQHREGRWYGQSDWSDKNRSSRDWSDSHRSQQQTNSGSAQDHSDYNPSRSGAEQKYDSTYWDRYSWDESTSSSPSAPADDSTLTYTYVIYSEPFLVGAIADGSSTSDTAGSPGQNQGDRNQQAKNQQRQGQTSQYGQSDAARQRNKLSGEIEGVRQMKLQDRSGRPETFTIAKVKLDNGSTTIISLGEQNRLRPVNLKKGDRIIATGQRGEIDGQSIFVAQQLEAGGRTFAVNEVVKTGGDQSQRMAGTSSDSRPEPQHASMQSGTNMPSGPEKTVQGRVAHFERAAPYAGQRAHTYVRVTLENGRTELIDLGDDVSLNQIDLQDGDRITVRGQQKRVGTRDVVVAQQLRIDGRQVLPAAE